MTTNDNDYKKYLERAIVWAKEAGHQMIEAYKSGDLGIEYKQAVDLVTKVDKSIETYIIQECIGKEFPKHAVLGEETFAATSSESCSYSIDKDTPTWCIDPIDGTTNFVHRFPNSCISIALVIQKEPVVGVLYNPIADELFTGAKGEGSFLNGKRCAVSIPKDNLLSESMISTNVGTDRTPQGIKFCLENMSRLLENNVRAMRSLGTSAIEVASVACGRFNAFYEFGIHAWDIAAAVCILREAGGVAYSPCGAPLDLCGRKIVAACSEQLAQQLIKLLDDEKPKN
mmetsp:Transcript_9754/g.14713  ORF Transcript_9754/g.14713 Transcript_9754/m.14713 type:complete len:285 (+) Transcript_9754:56-910(+)